MLHSLFSFSGRLSRLAFIGWTLAATAAVFAITFFFLILGGLLAGVFPAWAGGGPYLLGTAMAVVAMTIGIWTTLALQAKRIRDIGWRPLTWMLSVSIVMVADHAFLAPLTDLRFFPPLSQYTPLGGFVAAAYMIVLLCWPGVADAEAIVEAAAPAPRPQHLPLSPAPSSLLLVTPTQPAQRTEFGLRK